MQARLWRLATAVIGLLALVPMTAHADVNPAVQVTMDCRKEISNAPPNYGVNSEKCFPTNPIISAEQSVQADLTEFNNWVSVLHSFPSFPLNTSAPSFNSGGRLWGCAEGSDCIFTRKPAGIGVISATAFFSGSSKSCTAVMVAANLAITAGHCVFRRDDEYVGWLTPEDSTVFPALNSDTGSYGACRVKQFYSLVGWVRDGLPKYDIGAIKLQCEPSQLENIGKNLATIITQKTIENAGVQNRKAIIVGYQNTYTREQESHENQIDHSGGDMIFYRIHTKPISSGAGLYIEDHAVCGDSGGCVIAIHTHSVGSDICGKKTNCGTFITDDTMKLIDQWKSP